jgi:predicted ATPase/DNA-binding SARP family transcriptional activator
VEVEEGRWRLRKARALLKLLALTPGHRLHREQAFETLWPERDPAAAANNLRQALFTARRALDSCGDDGARRLGMSHEVLTLETRGLRIDVDEFEQAAQRAERIRSLDGYRAALDLYGGDLLPEDRFEAWTSVRRQSLRDRHLSLLIGIAALHEQEGDYAEAVTALQVALGQEPLHEEAHRQLMSVYVRSGRRQRALEQFHLLRDALQTEYADEPDDETRLLYRQILTRSLPAGSVGPAAAGGNGASRPPGNLSSQLTSFVGRERELRDLLELARRHRLVSLTGPGGCGKTRLALAAAAVLASEHDDGTWLVELAGLTEEALVALAIGEVLGVESRSARASEDVVAAHIGESDLLMVLDNCEHLVGRCALLAERLLGSCPNLRILATSREPLHVAAEVDWRVPSLAPAEAVTLFAERAAAVSSRFELSEANRSGVEEICRRVDGMPLAIELAAARVSVLAPAQIAERLRGSLGVLAGGRRTALTRQQTLRATIDWSHDLLDDQERRLFRRLGVFAGSFDLDAVESVCEGELDVFARLIDKSLVMVEEHEGEARYRLLETVRYYAREYLAQAEEQQDVQARHRWHYLREAERLEPVMDRAPARLRLSRESDQLREALRTALTGDPALGLRLAATLWRFWHDRGDRSEGARWLEEALIAAPEPSLIRAHALHGLSVLSVRMGDNRRAVATATEAVRFYRASGGRRALADELHHLATMSWVFSDDGAAVRGCEESLAIAEDAQDPAAMATIIHTLGVIAASRHRTDSGRGLIARSIELLGEISDDEELLLPVALGFGRFPGGSGRTFLDQTFVTARRVTPSGAVPYAQCDLACVERDRGDPAAARACLEESLLRFQQLGDDLGAAQALGQLGNLLADGGEHELARDLHEKSLALRTGANEARGIGLSLLAISAAADARGDFGHARRSAEQALALFERTGDQPGFGGALIQLGYVAADAGRLHEARGLQERALAVWRAFIGNSGWEPAVLFELADLDMALKEPERARDRLETALKVGRHIGDAAVVARCEAGLRRGGDVLLTPP